MGLNRIYKVIWSKTKGCYVVVSEMAKRVGRNKAKAIVMSTAAMAMAVAPAVMNVDRVEATVLIGAADGTTISANESKAAGSGIVIGGSISKPADESVIIGDNSGSMGSRNVVIGKYASAGYDEKNSAGNPPKDGAFNQSVAIGAGRAAGDGARAYGDQSIAIGSNTIARGNSSIAIGNDDVDKTDEIETTYTDLEGNRKTESIGKAYKALTGQSLGPKVYQDTTSKEAAVAIGVKAVAGDISLALGTGANADRVNAVAIGSGATATRDNAVAIGGGATTEAPGTKEVNATINDLKFTWKGGENTLAGDVVSFGKAGYERQLKHVAAGKVSKDSTDAINGSQFYGVLEHLTADPVYFYGADDSTAGKIEGVEAAQKSADALKKKVVAKSMADSRLNLLGGADKEKLSENNIGVTYGDISSIRFRLSKELAGLTSAEFKNTAGDVTTINGDGVTITPVANGKKPVSVTKNGLNNGGNVIANVAGNLEGAKPNSTEPTTNATAPNNASTIKNNAATVGDVLQAGWNLQNNSEERDFVKPYDTVNFIDGNGTSVAVDTTNDGTTSTVKYSVNLGNGLEKNSANKITIKPADKSLEVTTAGLKAKTDNTTITTGDSGLTVVTGSIEAGTTPGTVKVTDGDNDKIATVDSVVDAVNKAAFTLKASADGGTLNANSTVNAKGELIKAGKTIEMIAGKNLEVKHNKNGKITFATVENPSFETVQIGDDGPKFSATADGNIRVSDKDGTNPVKITNVKDGDISKTSKDAINGSQFHAVAKNTIKLAGQNGTDTATETAGQELDKQDGIKFTVKSSDGKLLDITADANGDTITITPKTGTITTTGGVPTAVTTNGKLVTVDEVVNALKDLGWKATAGTDGTGSMIGTGAAEELIKAGDTVTFKAGNNLSIKQDGKNFIYSLNPALTGLTSAEFKDGDNKVKITPTGITITKPAGTTENTVTLNQNGLNNGGNPITNVAGNLQGAKAGTDAPTTSATAPTLGTGADEVNKNNAATVGDVLNAGWNLQEKGVAKDFVKPYDTVNFIDGDGTSVAVATTNDGRTSTVKYSVNLGNGLEKTTDNKITVTPADKSLEVTTAGLKAKTDNTTITTGDSGLKVVTGGIEAGTTPGTMKVTNGDTGKIATVDSVVDAVNSAAFTLKASAITGGTRNTGSTVTATGESIKAGNTIEMIAGKNLDVTHNTNGKIIFATVENPSFSTVQIGNSEGPKFSATTDGNIRVSDKTDTKPVKITNVADGTISDNSKDAINGSQIHKLVNKAIKLAGQNGSEAAGETEPQTLTQQDPIKFTVKSSDGKLLEVTAGGDTITLTPKTGTITTTGGVPTATTTNGKLVTADEVVNALTEMGWKAIAGTDGTGTMIGTGAAEELIKAGNTVTFKAGDNLAIKQDGKNFIYSLKTDLTGLTSAEFKDGNNNAVKITPNGVSFKKPNATDADTVTLNQNGLNNGGNPITNVAGNLQGAKAGTDAPTTNATAPSLGTGTDQVNKNNAATVGDVLNAGWNLQNNDAAKDFVKPYDTVNFVNGEGTTAVVETTDQTTSKIKYNVNTGKGLEKTTDNKITVKPGDKSLEVTDAGVAVKKADQSLEVTDDGLKVKTDTKTITTGKDGLTVNTGTVNAVDQGDKKGTVEVPTADAGKIATVDTVAKAVNSAAFTLKASADGGTRNAGSGVTTDGESIKAGSTIEMIAGKNLDVKHDASGKITFATVDNPSFNTVQIGGNQGPKFSKTDAGDIKVSGSDNTTPVKITNVQDGDISADSKDAINGSQFHAVAKNKIKLAGQNGTSAATETDEQELDKKGGIKFTVKSSDGTLLDVAAKGDTIILTPKTATITTGKDGVPTANTDDGKLVTADNLVKALTEMGWKATAGTDGTGTMIGAGATEELIKAGNTVTFKAGDNLSIKQEGKNFIYSLNPALTGLTSAEFKDGKNNKVNITPEGITITKPADPTAGTPENTVTLNQNGLNNGGNPITNVTSNLVNYSDPVVNGKAPVRNELRKFDNNAVPNTNVATVGDLRNMGWVVSSNKTTGDLGNPYSETVKNADEVKFVGTGLATVSGKTENGVRTITVDVESKTAINAVTYTKQDGTKVYPVEGPNGTTYHTTPEGKGPNDETVDGSNVITSVNGPKGTKTPSTLTNVEGNLEGAKTGTNAPTTSATAPTLGTGADQVNKNNAATVGDVLQAGWNLQNNGTAKDFVKPYDTVNFADGNGTTAVVETTENKTSTVKYNVNLGNGLEKNDANQITVKPADSSLVVDAAGVKVNTGTINNVTTGDKPGTVAPNTDDDTKLATVGNVVSAINNAAWTATSAKTEAGELGAAATNQLVKAGDKVTFEADKNIKITQDAGKFTFATKDNVTFTTVQVGGDQGPKFSKTDAGDIKVSGSDNTTPVKITNVQDGEISETSTDAINGSQFHAVAKNKIKLAGQNGTDTATETDEQELDKKGGIKFTVKSSNGDLLEVTAAKDTITITPKTATITTGKDGVPTANTDDGKLVTADNLVKALTEMGWKATAGTDGTGTMIGAGATEELIKAGNTVTFKAGDNLSIKQEGKNFIYSLNPALTGLTSAEFKDGKNNKVNITPEGITITKPADPTAGTPENTVILNQNGLNNGGNPITNVAGNLQGAKPNSTEPTTSATAPTLGTEANQVNKNNAATVGDVLQAGWNLQNNGTAKDFVKPYDTVNFVNGGNTTAVVTTNAEGTVSDVTFNVTGLPVTYTTEDGAPVSKVGDKYYKVNDKGQPISDAGKPAVGKNNDGKLVDENNNVIEPVDTTKPLKTALVNPTPAGDKPNTTTATQLGNVTSGLDKYGDQVNNADVPGTTDKNRGLVDLSKPANGDPKVSDNTAATVGDLRNMGWIVSSNKTTGADGTVTTDEYSATVKNANEVKFVGEGTAIVSGKTEGDVRTITVKVDDQTSTNNAVTPVVYTDKDGNQVYPTGKKDKDGNQIFNKKPDGTGENVTGPVKTTINGPKGTDTPTTLSNVEGNLEGAKTNTTAPKTEATAPNTADATQPNYVNTHNAATVGDVLNAGWNLQNNGTAKDFVKPFDTVNFVNGLNTTAVVTTSDDGKTSNITYNVTGLPVTYATADGTPVSKIGDKFYKVNAKGQPVDGQGNPSTKVNNNGEPIDGNGNVITPIDTTANPLKTSLVNPTPETNKTGTTSPTTLDNVTSKLENYKDAPVNGKDPVRNSLVNLSKPENGQPNVSDNTVATVGDLRNMGWIVSSNKTTGENGAVTADEYSATVKNANEVKFVGEGTAIVSGKTEGDVRTITVKVDDQTSTNNAVTPVVYTDKDGKQVYPTGKVGPDGNQIFNTKPDGKGEEVTGPVKTTINGPKGTNSPTSLNNVKNNIPNVNDGSKTITDTDGNETAGDVTNINKAPLTAEEAAALANPKTKEGQTNPKYIGNNAATVSDVLNAGWNLQNNGTAKDFVKPYDTVNFRNGGNTTVTVTTDDNLTSHVQVNVTGLPVSNTITDPTTGKQVPVVKVGDAFYRTNPDGTPDIARNDKGEPTNGYVRANDGKLYPRENVTVTPPTDANGTPTITPNTGATPTTVNTNLVNPNVDNTTNEPGNNVSTPNQLGNVANGANTFNAVDADGKDYVKANNGKYYEPSKVNADGSLKEGTNATADAKNPLVLANDGKWYPADKVSDKGTPEAGATAVENPLAPKNAAGEPLVQAKDGKWYKPSDLQPNGTPTPTAKPQDNAINNKAGLVDFSNSNPNNVATIGDLQNMGWVVSAQGNSYSDQVRNTNEVKFVGEGTAIVTGKTDDKGVRTITVKVDDQVSTNNSVTPVVYTDKDGKTVYPIKDDKGNVTYHTTPDGKGENDKVIPNGDVNTSINGPKDDQGNTRPASLSNVKNNIPAVNDENKTITDADGKVKPDAGNVENINKAPMTAKDAADLLKPMKDGVANPKFVGNNAATVSDVLNAGWNLQNNGAARDFVKPFDTVNFVNGVNTTAVVTTSEDGTTSNVTYNVTGLPVTYTTADGTPVSKIGDKYYKVNDKGQPIDEQGNPSTKVNNNGEPIDGNGNVINAIDTAANPLKTSLVNPAPEANKTGTTSPTTLDNVTSKLANYSDPDVNGKAPVRNNLVDLSKPENGQPNVSDNTVATVGDLRNMGWIVSSDKTTGETDKAYTDTVKNANEVKFVGEGTAIVSGKTDNKGVRTITVKVDDQVSTNNSVTPVNYTKADGTKVYPKMVTNPDTGKEELKFFENPDGSGAEVPKGDVVTSINGPEGTTSPTTLKNVKNNIPNVNDGSKTITNPDGTEKAGDVENINKAPLTAEDAAKLSNPKTADGAANPKYIGNNAATVSDVLNAGWNLQNNGTAKDFVKPYDTVNFINGLGTTAVVTTREGNTTSDVTFNVKPANSSVTVDEDGVKVTTGEMKPEVGADNKETGAIATPVDPTTAKQLKDTLDAAVKELATAKDALKTAETALAAKPNDPALQKDVEDKKAQVAEKQTPVNNAQKAHDDAGLNKVATVQNVAEAINNSGFNLKTSADGGEKLTTGSKNDGELIKPGNTVEMVAGNNLTVKQDEHGKITYATKDDVTFKTVDTGTLNVGSPTTYTDGKGNTYTKVGENYYKPADVENGVPKQGATPVDVTTPVTPVSPVTMKAEAAKPATNNVTDAQPSSALNITSKDGKPTQITGVGSTLNTKSVDTTPAGTAPGTTPNTTPANLIDLEGTADAPVNKNAAATVGDLQNMGWVVSAKDGNGYKDVVKNANVVDFKGDQGVTVTGKTLADGTREITVGIKEGEVTNKVTITHGDGSKTDAVKIGDNYYKVDKDGKPVGFDKDENGKPAGTPLKVDPNTDKVTNAGAGVVTGNAVANAIQDSGWNVGIGSTDKDFSKDAKVYDKVNPNDDVKFANGANTNVSMVTVDALNEDGTKKATTYVKVDINRDLKIDSVTTGGTATDKNGNNLVKVGDQYYKEGDVTIVTNPDGTTTVTPKENAKAVPPADVIPAKDGAMIVKNADGKDVVSATVGKDGNGTFGINGKDGKNGISMTAKDGQGTIGVNGTDGKSTTIAGDTITIKDKDNNATNIGVNTITLVDKAGNTTTTTADKSEIKDAAGNINANTATGNTLKDPNGNTHTSTASTSELKDKDGNTNTSTPTTNVLKDTNGNTNTSAATGTTYKDKDENKTVVGPKEINISDKSGENTASLTNKDLLLNAKDPNTGVDKTSHVSGDKIAFTTTDEMEKVVDKDGKPVIDPATGKQKEVVKMEKVFDKDGKPVIDPATGKQKEVVKNPGNSTEYTNEGLKVIPNSTVARDVNGNPTFLDKDGKPVMKDTDGKYKYVGQDGKPGDKYDGSVGVLKPNVVDNTRVISFGMDKPVLDKNGKPVTGPDGNPVMTEGISAGMQQIHNVAPGTKDTDGVNVSQLRGTTININNRMNRMGAQAAALAGLQSIQYDPLEPTQISAGLGHYKGSSALALGVNHFKNESTMFHMGASYNGHGDETMMNASVTWKFGARADETAVKDTFRQGPISSAYTLQDKVSALEAQNKIQKDQLEELKALNEKQQEQIAELFKRLIEKA